MNISNLKSVIKLILLKYSKTSTKDINIKKKFEKASMLLSK